MNCSAESSFVAMALAGWLFVGEIPLASSGELKPEVLTFPAESFVGSKAQFAKTIDEVGYATQPSVKNLPAGTDLSAVMRSEYGDAAPWMWASIRKANSRSDPSKTLLASAQSLPDKLVLTEPLENFVFPVGPHWKSAPTVVVASKNDTLDSIAAHYLGANASNLAQARMELQKANPKVNFVNLHAGDLITVPQISFPRIVRPSSAAADIGAISGTHSEGPAEPLRPVAPVANNCQGGGPSWPVNWDAVMHVMSLNKARDPKLSAPDKTVVAVMDTGVAPNEDAINRIGFWHGGQDDGIGFDETTRDGAGHPQTPWQNFQDGEYRDHGTLVAGLIQGGDTAKAFRDELERYSYVMVLKVVGGGPSSAIVPIDAIGGAINDGLMMGHASVFNISIAPTAFQTAWDVLKQHQDALFVVAAGNGRLASDGDAQGYVLDFEELEPAELGGARSSNVISVAAHGSDGMLPKFSNRGKDTVTLAAPGCVIRSFVPTAAGTDSSNGTSFAAPLVSAASAVLASYHLSAKQIKERLIASVEWMPELDDFLFSGGIFSFEKALDVYSDILLPKPLKDGGVVQRGLLVTDHQTADGRYALLAQKEKPVQPLEVPLDHVLKLTVLGEADDGGMRVRMVWIVPGSTGTVRGEVVKLNSNLSFWADGAAAAQPIALNARLDIVLGSKVSSAQRNAKSLTQNSSAFFASNRSSDTSISSSIVGVRSATRSEFAQGSP